MEGSVHLGGFKNKNFELLVWSVKITLPPNEVQRAIFLKIMKVKVKSLFCYVNGCFTLFRDLSSPGKVHCERAKGNDEGREWKTKEDVKQRQEMGIIHMSCLAPFS